MECGLRSNCCCKTGIPCLQRHYMLLKMPLYLDLDVFHMRDHANRGGPEAGNLQQQFKNSEKFAFIFQIRNAAKS